MSLFKTITQVLISFGECCQFIRSFMLLEECLHKMHRIFISRRKKFVKNWKQKNKRRTKKKKTTRWKRTKDRVVDAIRSTSENILLFASLRQYSELNNNNKMEKYKQIFARDKHGKLVLSNATSPSSTMQPVEAFADCTLTYVQCVRPLCVIRRWCYFALSAEKQHYSPMQTWGWPHPYRPCGRQIDLILYIFMKLLWSEKWGKKRNRFDGN